MDNYVVDTVDDDFDEKRYRDFRQLQLDDPKEFLRVYQDEVESRSERARMLLRKRKVRQIARRMA